MDYLATKDGWLYLNKLRAATPDKSINEIINRAMGQIKSGSTIPKTVLMDSPLVKIVPVGKEVCDYSSFFTTMDELRKASGSKASLADLLAFP
ncbi:hypothetical protein [Pseudomonas syringae]|uniref:hypothetical protein n=1 Tax=Pseudomonas syringae TaxID=317 RepID=UPI0011D27B4C|nr:hypothetical protein [Pseudomonas syringae]